MIETVPQIEQLIEDMFPFCEICHAILRMELVWNCSKSCGVFVAITATRPCFLSSKIRNLPGELAPRCSRRDFAVWMSLAASHQTRLPSSCFGKMSNKAGGILVPRSFLVVRDVSRVVPRIAASFAELGFPRFRNSLPEPA